MLTLDALKSMGATLPGETAIGVDLTYATAVYDIPDDAPDDWKGLFRFPSARGSGRGDRSCCRSRDTLDRHGRGPSR